MDELEKSLLKSKHIIKKLILFKRSFLNKIKEKKNINVNIIKFFFLIKKFGEKRVRYC